MKSHATTTALLLFLLGTGYLSAQQPLFAPLGAVWHYEVYYCGTTEIYDSYKITVSEDSVIQGKYCTKLPNTACFSDASCSNYAYVHQEGSKVFIYEPLLNDFQMMFDFSLQAGDSYTYLLCPQIWEVDTVTIVVEASDNDPGGIQHLLLKANNPDSWWHDGFETSIAKGAGGLSFGSPLLIPGFCIASEPCKEYVMICYQTPDAGSYPQGCISAVNDEANTKDWISFYPSPASNYLTIELTSQKRTANPQLRIADAWGSLVKEIMLKPAPKNYTLPVQDWPSGMYFLQYLEDGEVKAAERFVVQR